MTKRQYKKPLSQTKHVDFWKCPYCRETITNEPKAMQNSGFDMNMGEFQEKCPECGKVSYLFISPTFIARPLNDDEVEDID